jgi:transcriptional antiterminator RfaH
LRWFLIFTKPAGENAAKQNLERQGFRVYYPRLVRPALYRGRWVDRIVALFPRYLFVQLDVVRQSMAPLRSTVGVANVVRFGNDAAVVPDLLVDDLLRRADPVSGLHRLSARRPFAPGDRVNVIAGAFEGLCGIFERDAGEERAVILLALLGRCTPVCVRSAFVVPSAS